MSGIQLDKRGLDTDGFIRKTTRGLAFKLSGFCTLALAFGGFVFFLEAFFTFSYFVFRCQRLSPSVKTLGTFFGGGYNLGTLDSFGQLRDSEGILILGRVI